MNKRDGIVPCRFAGGKFGLMVRHNGRLITMKRWFHLLDHEEAIKEFRVHQATLAGTALIFLVGAAWSAWMAAPALLCPQAGWVYALRFRRTGCIFMTRRSIWIGATPVDVAARPLLNGWNP